MEDPSQDLARQTVLNTLRRAALDTYGEQRVAESPFQAVLDVSATAVWRVMSVALEPMDIEPFQHA